MNILSDWVMKMYIEICNKSLRFYALPLPFSEIDGVILNRADLVIGKNDMFLKIEVENVCRMSMSITNYYSENNIYLYEDKKTQKFCNEDKITCFNRITINECVKKMVTLISQLRFNVSDGRFITTTDDVLPIKQLHLLTTLGKCKSKINECCICLEETETKFDKCKHSVCVRCISRMDSQINCPMCRCKINYDTDDDNY